MWSKKVSSAGYSEETPNVGERPRPAVVDPTPLALSDGTACSFCMDMSPLGRARYLIAGSSFAGGRLRSKPFVVAICNNCFAIFSAFFMFSVSAVQELGDGVQTAAD
jgi:hypothetical protein